MDSLLDKYSQEELANVVMQCCKEFDIPFDCGQSTYSFEPLTANDTFTITMESYVEEEKERT